MSRDVLYENERLTIVHGQDIALGEFYQIYDKELRNETPEGEGLVLDWSKLFGYEINLTGIKTNGLLPTQVILKYIGIINNQ